MPQQKYLVFRAPPSFAATEFATEISVIDLNLAAEGVLRFAFGHGFHELVLNEPCRGITDPQIPLQSQRGHASLGLADKVDRQEPNSQRQLSALEKSPSDE